MTPQQALQSVYTYVVLNPWEALIYVAVAIIVLRIAWRLGS